MESPEAGGSVPSLLKNGNVSSMQRRSAVVDGRPARGGAGCPAPVVARIPLTDSRKLASINAEINKLQKDQILEQLRSLRLGTDGNKERLKKRLKLYYRKQRAIQLARSPRQEKVYDKHSDFLCVIDLECTCEDGVYDYAHEIIEFPVVLVKTSTLEIVDEFRAFCKPQLHPVLTEFASKLTGISQETVDDARPFLDVLDDFRSWLAMHKLGTENRYSILTDGPWDMGKFFQMQCLLSGLPSVPHEFRYYINVRRSFSHMYNQPGKTNEWRNLQGMLDFFGMEFEGRAHSGIDDSRNIARIAIRMLRDGCELRINERLLRRDRAEFLTQKRNARMAERDKVRAAERQRISPTTPSNAATGHAAGSQKDSSVNNLTEPSSGRATPEKTEEQKEIDKAIAERLNKENAERQVWKDHLPYKVVAVSKQEYNMDMHEDCETCSEPDSENDVS